MFVTLYIRIRYILEGQLEVQKPVMAVYRADIRHKDFAKAMTNGISFLLALLARVPADKRHQVRHYVVLSNEFSISIRCLFYRPVEERGDRLPSVPIGMQMVGVWPLEESDGKSDRCVEGRGRRERDREI